MGNISLNSNQLSDVTLVSNIFIDYYMPAANGSYVKVYLYLLRCLSVSEYDITISSIADSLEDSEKDILRALNYWEKVHVITLKRENGSITGIHLKDLKKPYNGEVTKTEDVLSSNPAPNNSNTYRTKADTETAAVSEAAGIHNIQVNTGFTKPTYSDAQISELTSHDEIKWILNITEQYLKEVRVILPADLQLILYLYESVGFSAELILYLYDYCISKNKSHTSYIQAVALKWAEEGIDTVDKAEASAANYNSDYNAVKKAFGMDRSPVNIEKQFIDKWLNKLNFDTRIIVEACNRTILMTQKPDFKYADRILENWSKKKVRHLSDIAKLDEAHTKSQTKPAGTPVSKTASNNKFNAFPQRNYSKEELLTLEQKLLRK